MKGGSDAMTAAAAVEMVHATPPDKRSEFAKQIWSLRRKHGKDKRGSDVPFSWAIWRVFFREI
jgi:hypothetical protein